MTRVRIVLVPVGKLGRFTAELDGRPLVKPTRQPFFDAARALLREGWPAEAELLATHGDAAGPVAMAATLGEAAKWTIEERDRGGMRKRPWQPFAGTGGGPGTAADAPDAPLPLPPPDVPSCG